MLIRIIVLIIAALLPLTSLLAIRPPLQTLSLSPALPKYRILLVPLDSRPPCTQFVSQLGELAETEIILPPTQLLDNYNRPAKQAELRQWLADNISSVDAAILSSDMLIHGGLIASRHSIGNDNDVRATIDLLREIHLRYPDTPLYVFSIIPRLLLADSPADSPWQTPIMQYSIVKHQSAIFDNPVDFNRVAEWEDVIPPEIIARYKNLYAQNVIINKNLIDLTKENTIHSLILGQDDGYPFGLPNQSANDLRHYADRKLLHERDRVIITRGADEVALTMLGQYITGTVRKHRPQIFVAWSDPSLQSLIMPFMPHSAYSTVEEKIKIIGGDIVDSPDQADFILFLHLGTIRTHEQHLKSAAITVNNFIKQGHHVAVIDLSEDYFSSETLLPYLISENVDLTKLAAYAGWNTSSNSIGTAVTQAALFTGTINLLHETSLPGFRNSQLNFLISRFVDDWYFQKEVQGQVNSSLRKHHINPYHLQTNHNLAIAQINRRLEDRTQSFFRRSLRGKEFSVGNDTYVLTALEIDCRLPWDRTFEIDVTPLLRYNKK